MDDRRLEFGDYFRRYFTCCTKRPWHHSNRNYDGSSQVSSSETKSFNQTICEVVTVWCAWLFRHFGLIPVNNDFRAANNGIQIYIVSNAVHADIIVPKTSAVIDWSERFGSSEFSEDINNKSHVSFGWGDREFFLETETWDDFKLSTAVNALLLPSSSCIHVSFVRPGDCRDAVAVTISKEQYNRLAEFIESSFRLNENGTYLQIPGEAYSTNDAFFLSAGRYHIMNTCNSWVGRGLKQAGVKTPWFSPMPKSPTLYIENEQVVK